MGTITINAFNILLLGYEHYLLIEVPKYFNYALAKIQYMDKLKNED